MAIVYAKHYQGERFDEPYRYRTLKPQDFALLSEFMGYLDAKPTTKETYKRALRQFLLWLNENAIERKAVDKATIVAYKEHLRDWQRLDGQTVGLYLTAVRRLFDFLENRGLHTNVTKGVKSPKKAVGHKKLHLTGNQAHDLLQAATATTTGLRDFAILRLMLGCGLRTIEVVRANIGDIRNYQGHVILKVWGKGHDTADNYVLLTPDTQRPIAQYLATRPNAAPTEPLFVSESRQNSGQRLTTRTVSKIAKTALKAIGLDSPEYTAHSLRHTTAVAILKAGGTTEDVQAVLRHANIATSQIYTESIKEELRLKNSPENLINKGLFA